MSGLFIAKNFIVCNRTEEALMDVARRRHVQLSDSIVVQDVNCLYVTSAYRKEGWGIIK